MSFLTQQKNGLLYHTSTVLEGGGRSMASPAA